MDEESSKYSKETSTDEQSVCLKDIGCSAVSLFEGGGVEATFDDGSLIHVAPCASSFLLQLPPHRDTPYGCGLHKVSLKTLTIFKKVKDKLSRTLFLD